MSSEAITRNDLTAILNEVLPPTPSEYRKLLWTNPNPTSAFVAQNISLDLSNYDAIEIVATMYLSNSVAYREAFSGKVGDAFVLSATIYGTTTDITRLCETNNTQVIINTGYVGTTQNNQAVIPYQIYGIKYERVAPPQVETPIIQTLTVTAQTDASGYFHLPTSLNDVIPIWAEVSGRPAGLRPCFLANGYTDTARYGLRFKTWNDTVTYTSTTITVTIYYIKLVN